WVRRQRYRLAAARDTARSQPVEDIAGGVISIGQVGVVIGPGWSGQIAVVVHLGLRDVAMDIESLFGFRLLLIGGALIECCQSGRDVGVSCRILRPSEVLFSNRRLARRGAFLIGSIE